MVMKPSKTVIFLSLVAAATLWSSSPVVNKILLKELPPLTVAFYRYFFALVVMLPFFFGELKKNPPITWQLIGISLLATANVTIFLFGLRLTVPNASSILYATTPLLVTLYAMPLLKEYPSLRKSVGVGIGLVGALMVIVLPALRQNQELFGNWLGNLIIFTAVNTWAGYTIGSRYLSAHKGYTSRFIMIFSFMVATVVLAPLMIGIEGVNIASALRPEFLALHLYMALFVTVVTYFLYQWAISHSSASTASLMGYIQPPTTFVLAWLFLGDRLTFGMAVGAALALIGVYVATETAKTSKVESLKLFFRSLLKQS